MKQITVIIKNEVGKLADISFILGNSKINIDAVSAGIVGDTGIINLIVKDSQKATTLLKKNGYKCLANDVLVLKLQNSPGKFAEITKILSDKNISIQNTVVLSQDSNHSLYSLRVNRFEDAKSLLKPYLDLES